MDARSLKNKITVGNMMSYLCVGGIATLVEWAGFYVLDKWLSVNYLVATALAFAISTFVNWIIGRLWTFKDSKKSALKEVAAIYAVSAVGLLLNLIIMRIMVGSFGIEEMISKITATVIVFAYNYLVRRLLIYR